MHKVIESIQSRIHILRLEPPNRNMVEKLTDNIINSEKMGLSEKQDKNYIKEKIKELTK